MGHERDHAHPDRALSFLRLADARTLERAGIRPSGDADFDRALSGLVTSAALAHDAGDLAVSFSRRKAWYAAEGRYQGNGFTYVNVMEAVEHAAATGLVIETRAKPGSQNRRRGDEFGIQSTLRATPTLVAAFADATYVHTLPTDAMVRMRDEAGETMPLPTTRAARRVVREMEELNEIQASTRLDLAHPDVERTQAHWICPTRNGGRVAVLATPDCRMVRIFGRGRLDKHGRLYGAWQSVPKAIRAAMTINGEAVAEPDFAFNHAHLLYAMAGVPLVGDPYETGTHDRDDGKVAFVTLLNAASVHAAVSSLFRRAWGDGIVRTHAYCTSLAEAVLARNEPIRHLLGRDLGVDLMHLDSRVTIEVMKECGRAGIPVAPVHDSVVCPGRDACKVAEIMGSAGARVCGAINPSPITINGQMVPQVPSPSSSLPLSPPSAPVPTPAPKAPDEPILLPDCASTRAWAVADLPPSEARERDRLITLVKTPGPGDDPLAGWDDHSVFMLHHVRLSPAAAASWLQHVRDHRSSVTGDYLHPDTVDPRKLGLQAPLRPKPRRPLARKREAVPPGRLPPTVRTAPARQAGPAPAVDPLVAQILSRFPSVDPASIVVRPSDLVGGVGSTYPAKAS